MRRLRPCGRTALRAAHGLRHPGRSGREDQQQQVVRRHLVRRQIRRLGGDQRPILGPIDVEDAVVGHAGVDAVEEPRWFSFVTISWQSVWRTSWPSWSPRYVELIPTTTATRQGGRRRARTGTRARCRAARRCAAAAAGRGAVEQRGPPARLGDQLAVRPRAGPRRAARPCPRGMPAQDVCGGGHAGP